jgi:hypothetical protein
MNTIKVILVGIAIITVILWVIDSKTIERIRNRRAYWASIDEHAKAPFMFEEEMYRFIEEHEKAIQEEHKRRNAARAPHELDNEILLNLAKEELRGRKEKTNPRMNAIDFWLLIAKEEENRKKDE